MEWPPTFYEQRGGIGCPLCVPRDDESRFWTSPVADAHLVRADIQRGLSVVVWRGRHVAEPTELNEAEAAAYGREVLRIGRALEVVLRPVKLNYSLLGNSVPHVHTHVIPRYAEDPRPGWPFPFPDPDPPAMSDKQLRRDVALLRAELTR